MKKRPNLLFIWTDEQRTDTLGCYGNRAIAMPNLDRLAQQSFVFDRTYVTQPVCTPSRSTVMTGLYPHTNGCTENNIPLADNIPCLPELVREGDYATGYHGKWHLGDEVFAQHGFDEWRSTEGYRQYFRDGRDRNTPSSYEQFLWDRGLKPQGEFCSRPEAAALPEEFGKPAFLAREATRFIRENRDRPFILNVNFLEPHMPFTGPRDGQYDVNSIPLPDNFDHPPTEQNHLRPRLFCAAYRQMGHGGLALKTQANWRQLISNYWGLCSLVDTHTGVILKALEDNGLMDNTIIVFTSDHGDMMGSHRLLAKCVMYEEAVRVPMLIRLPGQSRNRRINGPVSQIDIVPTLLELMNQPIPDHLEGKSLVPLLQDDAPAANQDVFIEWNGQDGLLGDMRDGCEIPEPLRALAGEQECLAAISDPIRTLISPDGWKLNFSRHSWHELFNLNDDPLETVNLADRPEQRSRLSDMAVRIAQWQQQTRDCAPRCQVG